MLGSSRVRVLKLRSHPVRANVLTSRRISQLLFWDNFHRCVGFGCSLRQSTECRGSWRHVHGIKSFRFGASKSSAILPFSSAIIRTTLRQQLDSPWQHIWCVASQVRSAAELTCPEGATRLVSTRKEIPTLQDPASLGSRLTNSGPRLAWSFHVV